jgi:hypothetical protein
MYFCNSFEEDPMKQAKTLTDQELQSVLDHVKQRSHSARTNPERFLLVISA